MIKFNSILQMNSDFLDDRSKLKAVLLDLYPTEKRMINLLLILYDYGIPEELKQAKKVDSLFLERYITQAEREYGISENYIREAMEIWLSAFGHLDNIDSVSKDAANDGQEANVQPADPGEYDTRWIKTYEYSRENKDRDPLPLSVFHTYDEDTVNGYFITLYKGHASAQITVPSHIGEKNILGIRFDAYKDYKAIQDLYISDGIKYIDVQTFDNCQNLRTVRLPNSLERIGVHYFNVDRPWAFDKIGAFCNCGIEEIVIPDSVKILGSGSFSGCKNLRKAILPKQLTTIGNAAFYECTSLTEINLPHKLEYIDDWAFADCTSLTKVRLPESLKKVSFGMFYACKALKDLYIPYGAEKIDDWAFDNSGLTRIFIPPTVTRIGGFYSCSVFDGCHDVTIYCEEDSTAMVYAIRNGIDYRITNFWSR